MRMHFDEAELSALEEICEMAVEAFAEAAERGGEHADSFKRREAMAKKLGKHFTHAKLQERMAS